MTYFTTEMLQGKAPWQVVSRVRRPSCCEQHGKPLRPLSADVGARGPQVTKRLPFSCLPAGCNVTAASQPRNLCLAFVVNEEGFRFTESSL